MAARLNPFVPGRGAMPPYLAGREAEKRTLKGMLAYLQAGRGAARDVVLCGPRGNGKTVLLRWFQQEVEALGGEVDLVWRTPSDLPSVDALATTFVPPARFKAMLPDTLSLSVGLGRVGWELGNNPGTLSELLAARCRQRPLIVLLDEAHTLQSDTGRALLNASQSVSVAPFLLVLAGTPGLVPHLDSMAATFWDRAEQLPIGLLDRDAAAEALTRPFEAGTPRVAFDASVLSEVLDHSQCYPYFLQLLGAALWDAAAADQSTAISRDVLQRASAAFERRRETYYRHRHNELERAGLIEAASAIASAFQGRASMVQAEVDSAIEAVLSPEAPHSVFGIRDALAAVGYIWNPAGERDRWRPGIPSLMAYIDSLARGLP